MQQVKIVKSSELSELGLSKLVHRVGVIVDDSEATEGHQLKTKPKGHWVRLIGGPFEGEHEWFIPQVSIKKIRERKS